MLQKYTEQNKFGGCSWLIEISPELNILINETNNSFLIELQKKGFFKRKTFASFNSTLSFKETIIESFDKLFMELQSNSNFHWTIEQKDNKLQNVLITYENMYENL